MSWLEHARDPIRRRVDYCAAGDACHHPPAGTEPQAPTADEIVAFATEELGLVLTHWQERSLRQAAEWDARRPTDRYTIDRRRRA